MIRKKLMQRTILIGPVLAALLGAGIVLGCTSDTGIVDGRDTGNGAVATQEIFERGGGEQGGGEGGEGSGGESGPDGPEGAESGGAGNEATMSSPIVPLDQTWDGVLGGLAISAQYDAATQSVNATVQTTTSQALCYVQAEPHLKSGTQTVGELGPDMLGDLNPGQQATSGVSVASEPSLSGVAFDGYVVHMEVFDCGGPGPVPHAGGEGAEGPGGEGHGPGGEGGSEEGSGATLALDETFDAVRGGARLILNYDAPSNSFIGTVENTTGNVLSNVRIEVHLSNGTELGPTTPVDMAPGEVMAVNLPATQASFTGWIAHAEVGRGEGSQSGGEHGGSQSGGEHGGGEGDGEHGGGESGGEHGSSDERRGGG